MTQNKKIKLKKGDIITVAAVLIVCAILFVFSRPSGEAVAQITVDGAVVYEAALSDIKEPENITLTNGVVVTAEQGAIYFSYSPCAGHDCVRTGRLTRAGQCAVCLPQKTVIKITGKTENDLPDAIT